MILGFEEVKPRLPSSTWASSYWWLV